MDKSHEKQGKQKLDTWKNDKYDESGGPLLNEERRYVMKLEINNNLQIGTIPGIMLNKESNN